MLQVCLSVFLRKGCSAYISLKNDSIANSLVSERWPGRAFPSVSRQSVVQSFCKSEYAQSFTMCCSTENRIETGIIDNTALPIMLLFCPLWRHVSSAEGIFQHKALYDYRNNVNLPLTEALSIERPRLASQDHLCNRRQCYTSKSNI